MNLLEIVNSISQRAHDSKEHLAATAPDREHGDCRNHDYCRCELTTGMFVFRGGEHAITLWLEDHELRYPLSIAARIFGADQVAVAIDGRNAATDRPMLCTVAVNRAGDELWKVEPYNLAPDGRSVIWWPAEVPNTHPILADHCKDDFVRMMMKSTMPMPPFMERITPGMTFEERQAICDIGIIKQVVAHANDPRHNIFAIHLAATPGTGRARIVDLAGHKPEMWL